MIGSVFDASNTLGVGHVIPFNRRKRKPEPVDSFARHFSDKLFRFGQRNRGRGEQAIVQFDGFFSFLSFRNQLIGQLFQQR